jgi:hypothetical protein
MRVRSCLFIAIVLASFATAAAAERYWPVAFGNSWTYEFTGGQETWRVTAWAMNEGFEAFIIGHEGNPANEGLWTYYNMAPDGDVLLLGFDEEWSRRYEPPLLCLDADLYVGKQWEQTITVTETDPDTSYQVTVTGTVVELANHSVPAGEFEAFRIDVRFMPDDYVETWWWAPSVGPIEYGDMRLASYSLVTPVRQTTWGRVKALYRGK